MRLTLCASAIPPMRRPPRFWPRSGCAFAPGRQARWMALTRELPPTLPAAFRPFRLTPRLAAHKRVSRGWLDDRGADRRKAGPEESPDSMKQGCRVTPAGATPGKAPQRTRQPCMQGQGETVG